MKRRVSRRRRIINRSSRSYGRGRGGGRSRSSQINIASFIEQAKQESLKTNPTSHEVTRTFADFGLDAKLLQNIAKLGFEEPTPIQDASANHILEGSDLLGEAHTGTGKTGAFLIPAIQNIIDGESKKMIVIAPTRELALQINELFMQLTYDIDMYSVLCIGGKNMRKQLLQVSRRHEILVGTPGRLMDLAKRNAIELSDYNMAVLDEVDRMLDMGFVRDIKKILSQTARKKQSLYFTATTTDRVVRLIGELSYEVVRVSVKSGLLAKSIDHGLIRYEQTSRKLDLLHDLLLEDDVEKTLIFGRTKRGVNRLVRELNDRGFRADAIHGNKSQAARQRALRAFRDDVVSILVATDVAARGLDIDDVSHVVNFEAPETYDDYIHRAGRTGRAGKPGKALTFVQ